MAKRFVLAVVLPAKPIDAEKRDALRRTVSAATDWLRLAPSIYILYTNRTLEGWYARFREVLDAKDELVITELDPANMQGRLQEWVWDWLSVDRSEYEVAGNRVNVASRIIRPLPP